MFLLICLPIQNLEAIKLPISNDVTCSIGNTKTCTVSKKYSKFQCSISDSGASIRITVAKNSVLCRWNMVEFCFNHFWSKINFLSLLVCNQCTCSYHVCACARSCSSAPVVWQSEILLSLYVSGELRSSNLHSLVALSVQEHSKCWTCVSVLQLSSHNIFHKD